MKQRSIDINCDMGESFGNYSTGNDTEILPWISSCNVACGFHGGDPFHIDQTLKRAVAYGIRIGAHPGYPDLGGFGRRKMQIGRAELKAILTYQIAALKGMAESVEAKLAYVKPHGALYNTASTDTSETEVILSAIRDIDPTLAFMGLAGSIMQEMAERQAVPFIAEAFADRLYEPDGTLMSRSKAGSVIHDPEKAVAQVLSIVQQQQVLSSDGSYIPIHADSICIHGDNPAAVAILRALDQAFLTHQIEKIAQGR